MSQTSSLLRYLPPVTYAEPPDGSGPSLNDLLLIFEKLLIGIDDGIRVEHQARDETPPHHHEGLQAVIGRIPDLLSPWKTPAELLPMLASWLALELPDFWDEYQRRKIISEIAEIYRMRGTKAGLQRHLELYLVGESRPRIVIDDGSCILFTRPELGRLAAIHALQSSTARIENNNGSPTIQDGLLRPWCIAVEQSTGDLYVGDRGSSFSWDPPWVERGVWRIPIRHASTTANTDYMPERVSAPAHYQRPDNTANFKFGDLVDLTFGGRDLYILDRNRGATPTSGLYRLIFDGDTASSIAKSLEKNGPGERCQPERPLQALSIVGTRGLKDKKNKEISQPVAMAFLPNQHLILLDHTGEEGRLHEYELEVKLDEQNTGGMCYYFLNSKPVRTVELGISKPLALTVQGTAVFVSHGPFQSGANKEASANVLVTNPWPEGNVETEVKWSPLLQEQNDQLIAPVSLVAREDGSLYVLDVGLWPIGPAQGHSPFFREKAKGAVISNLKTTADSSPVPITETGDLVYPTDMAVYGETVYICDPGMPPVEDQEPYQKVGQWRLKAHEFAVLVSFMRPKLTQTDHLELEEVQTLNNVSLLIGREKPAHTLAHVVSTSSQGIPPKSK